jgi:RNA recognition motif-containing protein
MVMLNMVTPEELQDDQEYNDILEDINEECGKFGSVEGVRIPRPVAKKQKKGWQAETMSAVEADQNRRMDEANGVGRVYVMFTDVASAKTAMEALGGRQFGGRTILVASVSEVSQTNCSSRVHRLTIRTSSLATSRHLCPLCPLPLLPMRHLCHPRWRKSSKAMSRLRQFSRRNRPRVSTPKRMIC